jgi:hypothetical protein
MQIGFEYLLGQVVALEGGHVEFGKLFATMSTLY